jgi:hypothetical protein
LRRITVGGKTSDGTETGLAMAAGSGDAAGRVPDEVIERAKAAYSRRSAGPVAAIVSDAIVEPGGERLLRFEHELVQVDVRVCIAGARRDVWGRVDPPQLRVELELEGSPVTVAEEATGSTFAFEGVPRGVMRLVFHQGAQALTTDWFST